MNPTNFEEVLLSIDEKIDSYQAQYCNGMKEVGNYINDLQEIRSVLAQYYNGSL